MNFVKLMSGGTLALLLTTGCNRTSTTMEERNRERELDAKRATTERAIDKVAYVRFLDAHTGNETLYFGDKVVFSGDGTKITDYKQVQAERAQFALRGAGKADGDPLATNSEGLDAGKHYTVIAFDNDRDSATLRVLSDNESAPEAGKAKVRLVHASPEMEALKLYAVGQKKEIADQSRFSTGSNWHEVEPVAGNLELRSSDNKAPAIRIPNVHLQAGKLYTFIVEGGGDAKHRFKVTPVVDTPRS